MNSRLGTQAYAKVDIESGVMSASPHQLIMMLFDGALTSLRRALILIEQKDIAEKGQAISKAINIIDNGLKCAIKNEQGSSIADNLVALYDYMVRRLLQANLKSDGAAVQEVIDLLKNIADAWREIGSSPRSTQDVGR